MFYICFLLGLILFYISFLTTRRLEKNKTQNILLFKYIISTVTLIIPFFYTLYLSGGYWSTNIRIIYLTVSFIWPVLSIYAFTTSKSFIEGYVLSIAFYLIPLILFASASGIIPKTLISQLINIDLLVGFFVWFILKISSVIRAKQIKN